jgi:hypothetical protein
MSQIDPTVTFNRVAGTLTIEDPEDPVTYESIYSGDKDHYNQPQFEQLSKKGPIPAGTYKLQYQASHPILGEHVFELEPIGGQPMYGRDGFFIHGDNEELNHTASEGCIIAPKEVRLYLLTGDILLVK